MFVNEDFFQTPLRRIPTGLKQLLERFATLPGLPLFYDFCGYFELAIHIGRHDPTHSRIYSALGDSNSAWFWSLTFLA